MAPPAGVAAASGGVAAGHSRSLRGGLRLPRRPWPAAARAAASFPAGSGHARPRGPPGRRSGGPRQGRPVASPRRRLVDGLDQPQDGAPLSGALAVAPGRGVGADRRRGCLPGWARALRRARRSRRDRPVHLQRRARLPPDRPQLLHDGDLDLTNNLARPDYLPFYWRELGVDLRSVRPGLEGGLCARLYQTFQVILLLPGLRDGRPRGGRAHHERPRRGGDGTRLLALPGHRGDQSGRPSWHGWERR